MREELFRLAFFAGGVLAGSLVCRVLPELLRGAGLTRRNYRGEVPPTAGGLLFVVAAVMWLGHPFLPAIRATAAAAVGFGLLGLLDDRWGHDGPKGLRGHLRALIAGSVTTGLVKLCGGLALGLVLGVWLRSGWEGAVGGLLIALAANAFNLLDLRPLRALKVFWLLGMPLAVIAAPVLALFLGLSLPYAWLESRRRVMLGDTGANLLGGALGTAAAGLLPIGAVGACVVLLAAFHVWAERYSLTIWIAARPWAAALDAWGRPPETDPVENPATTVTILGAAAALPGPGEETASYVVNGRLLVDCGWNCTSRLLQHGYDPCALEAVFLTHCRHDHYLGLPGLLFYRGMRAGKAPMSPLTIVGPPDDLPVVLEAAWRFLQAQRFPRAWPQVEVAPLAPGDEMALADLHLSTLRARHPITASCLRLTDPATGVVITFTGDTGPHPELAAFAAGADMLIHEAGVPADAPPSQRREDHSRPQDAADVARAAGVGRLLLTHLATEQRPAALSAAQELFPATELAVEGRTLAFEATAQVRLKRRSSS